MKKWFEYQCSNQRLASYKPGSVSMPIANVKSAMQPIFDHIADIYHSPSVTRKIEKIFSQEAGYLDTLAPNVPVIDRDILQQWVYDTEFSLLLDKPSHEVVYFHEDHDRDFILDAFRSAMVLDHVQMKPGMGSVKLHVQHPGQMFPLHFDRPQYRDFNLSAAGLSDVPAHQRYLVFMEDQRPGQIFQMDMDCISWKQGDVFTWDARNTMHGSSNFGYWPRFLLMFTIRTESVG